MDMSTSYSGSKWHWLDKSKTFCVIYKDDDTPDLKGQGLTVGWTGHLSLIPNYRPNHAANALRIQSGWGMMFIVPLQYHQSNNHALRLE